MLQNLFAVAVAGSALLAGDWRLEAARVVIRDDMTRVNRAPLVEQRPILQDRAASGEVRHAEGLAVPRAAAATHSSFRRV